MKLLSEVSWENSVRPTWQATHPHIKDLNCDVWEALPSNVRWYRATIEANDLQSLRLIGTLDIRRALGSCSFSLVSQRLRLYPDRTDQEGHIDRVLKLSEYFSQGHQCAELILVSPNPGDRMTFIDGNHRALALHMVDRLVGQPVFIGFSQEVETTFGLYIASLAD